VRKPLPHGIELVSDDGRSAMGFPSRAARARFLRRCTLRGVDPYGVEALALWLEGTERQREGRMPGTPGHGRR